MPGLPQLLQVIDETAKQYVADVLLAVPEQVDPAQEDHQLDDDETQHQYAEQPVWDKGGERLAID